MAKHATKKESPGYDDIIISCIKKHGVCSRNVIERTLVAAGKSPARMLTSKLKGLVRYGIISFEKGGSKSYKLGKAMKVDHEYTEALRLARHERDENKKAKIRQEKKMEKRYKNQQKQAIRECDRLYGDNPFLVDFLDARGQFLK
jgi:hypothetical protein